MNNHRPCRDAICHAQADEVCCPGYSDEDQKLVVSAAALVKNVPSNQLKKYVFTLFSYAALIGDLADGEDEEEQDSGAD